MPIHSYNDSKIQTISTSKTIKEENLKIKMQQLQHFQFMKNVAMFLSNYTLGPYLLYFLSTTLCTALVYHNSAFPSFSYYDGNQG